MIASPPCQAWSTAGNQKGVLDQEAVFERIAAFAAGRDPIEREWADERSKLTAEPMRWAVALRPRWIALEQVPPVLPLWQYMAELLRSQGYRTWCGVLSAEEYGVAQTRKRAILIARNDGIPVGRPEPTHQPYRSGREPLTEPNLFGDPLPPPVSMAEALGWGVDGRPAWTVTSGGSESGGVEVFAYADARRQIAQARNSGPGAERDPRLLDAPSYTIRAQGSGSHPSGTEWVLRSNYGTGGDSQDRGERTPDEPAATVTSKVSRNQWVLRNGNQDNACERRACEPAGTLYFGQRTNAVDWVVTRPATTVCGDARLGAPGHRDREGGERQFGEQSARVTVQEAGVLQSFPWDYPWQGTKSKQYEQVGNAVPPLLAAAILRPLLLNMMEVAA